LVPLDGSETSERAVDVAAEFAAPLNAEIVLCHVADLARAAAMSAGEAQLVAGCLDALRDEGRAILDDGAQRIKGRVPVATRIVDGQPVDAIERLAAEISAAYIVLGSHGRTGLTRLVLGSVAEGVVRRARIPVVVVPHAVSS
jgi:nucleotide-binding universal stress UspA family protein